VSELTPSERITAEALALIREGKMPPIPFWLHVAFMKIALRNPDLVARTKAEIRKVIEKTTN
jgi:hypothetical protein